MSASMPPVLDAIDEIVASDIEHGFTSAQLAIVKDGRMVYQNAWGTVNAYNPNGTPKTDSPAVTSNTLYDLASNTKMYSVNYALQYLVTNGQADLDARIVGHFRKRFCRRYHRHHYNGYENPGLATVKTWKASLTIRDISATRPASPPTLSITTTPLTSARKRRPPVFPTCFMPAPAGTMPPAKRPCRPFSRLR